MPDAGTAAAARQSGEVDWWETPNGDLVPLLRQSRDISVAVKDPTGDCRIMRPDQLYPPFDNPAIRRALTGAINQTEFMTAMMGTDKTMWKLPCGFFTPDTPLVSSTASSPLPKGVPNFERVKAEFAAAGYEGEKIVLLAAIDSPARKAMSDMAADTLRQAGMNVDYQAMDWGTVMQRRSSRKPPAGGGWNLFCTGFTGLDFSSPAVDLALRGNGKNPWFGWPESPKLEGLRNDWFAVTDLAAQQKIGSQTQAQAFVDVPIIRLDLPTSRWPFAPTSKICWTVRDVLERAPGLTRQAPARGRVDGVTIGREPASDRRPAKPSLPSMHAQSAFRTRDQSSSTSRLACRATRS